MKRIDVWLKDNEDWRPHVDLVVYPPMPEEILKEFPNVSSDVLARCGELVVECGGHVTRGAIYVRIRREDKKCGDRWATMLCLQAPPGLQTTDTFWAGRKPWHEVFGDPSSKKNNTYINNVKQQLAKRGVNLKPNDEYMPELARFVGDPEAVVPFGGARSYIKNLCEKRGWACDGAVSTSHREPERDELDDSNCVPLAPDLIKSKTRQMVSENPDLKMKSRSELRQMAIDKYGPSKTKPKKIQA